MPDQASKDHILRTLQDWAGARGCGTMRERMNAALDALEANGPLPEGEFEFAYREAKRIIESRGSAPPH